MRFITFECFNSRSNWKENYLHQISVFCKKHCDYVKFLHLAQIYKAKWTVWFLNNISSLTLCSLVGGNQHIFGETPPSSEQIPLKCWNPSIRLHNVIMQKTTIWIFTIIETSYLTCWWTVPTAIMSLCSHTLHHNMLEMNKSHILSHSLIYWNYCTLKT